MQWALIQINTIHEVLHTYVAFYIIEGKYRKIPIISPGLVFGQRAFSPIFFLQGLIFGGGGGLINGQIFAF